MKIQQNNGPKWEPCLTAYVLAQEYFFLLYY